MRLASLTAALLAAASVVAAPRDITGYVVDETQQPITFAQIVAFDCDSTSVAKAATNENGFFVLDNSKNEITNISIYAFGYEPLTLHVSQALARKVHPLTPLATDLGDVVITSQARPVTKMVGGDLEVKIENTFLSNSGTALDVLRWIPTVTEKDGAVTVTGRGAPLIYINKRPITSNLELEQLQAENIKDVKLIRNPGAKYGNASAVIIVQTKAAVGEGFGVDARARGTYNVAAHGLGQVDLTYRTGGLDLSLMGYTCQNIFENTSSFHETVFGDTEMHQTMDDWEHGNDKSQIGKFAVNYQFNANHSIGAYVRGIFNYSKVTNKEWGALRIGEALRDSTCSDGEDYRPYFKKINSNLYYSGTMGHWDLDFNASTYFSHPRRTSQWFQTDMEGKAGEVSYLTDYKPVILAEKLVASYKNKGMVLEFGEEFSYSDIHKDIIYSDNTYSDSRSLIKQKGFAGFLQYRQNIGENAQLKAGVRYERLDYDYISGEALDRKDHRILENLTPNVELSVSKDRSGVTLSYRQGVNHPSYSDMTENVTYTNQFQLMAGNPDLKSSRTETTELMAFHHPFFLSASYKHEKDPIMTYAFYLPEMEMTVVTNINGNEKTTFSGVAGLMLDIGKWNTTLSAGVSKQQFEMEYRGETMKFNQPIGFVQWENQITLPWNLKLSWDVSYQTRGNAANAFTRSSTSVNAGLYKTFLNKKLDVRLTGTDLLASNRSNMTVYCGDMRIATKSFHKTRGVSLTVRWHFNVPKNKYKGSDAGGSVNSRT